MTLSRTMPVWCVVAALAACGGGDRPEPRDEPDASGAPPASTDQPEPQVTPQPSVTSPEPPPPRTGPVRKLVEPSEGGLERRAVATRLLQRRLYVGFQDDPSFRWNEDRQRMIGLARTAGATVLRATVEWPDVAPSRPKEPADPFDPAYRFENVDELVRNAQRRGLEVMLTLWGTPGWANGDAGRNRAPRRLADLTAFAAALAARYSGRHAGYPFVRFFSVWNEPNLEQFLAPQYDRRGRSVAPVLYAKLYAAAHVGLERGSPGALVAIGETSPRGRDRPSADAIQDSHSPGRFARLVAQAAPRLRFDAWAHHPYPIALRRQPAQTARWPNVALTQLDDLGRALDVWFGRESVRLWVTEYAYQTRPEQARGVTYADQAAYARRALRIAAANPRVAMFVWFTFRDDPGNPWKSGLLSQAGRAKPAYARFAAETVPLDARMIVTKLEDGMATVRASALELAYFTPPGSPVGVVYRVRGGGLFDLRRPRVRLGRDGWITFRVPLEPAPGERYVLEVDAHDVHGHTVTRALELVGVE